MKKCGHGEAVAVIARIGVPVLASTGWSILGVVLSILAGLAVYFVLSRLGRPKSAVTENVRPLIDEVEAQGALRHIDIRLGSIAYDPAQSVQFEGALRQFLVVCDKDQFAQQQIDELRNRADESDARAAADKRQFEAEKAADRVELERLATIISQGNTSGKRWAIAGMVVGGVFAAGGIYVTLFVRPLYG
jgi:hypothetical protein